MIPVYLDLPVASVRSCDRHGRTLGYIDLRHARRGQRVNTSVHGSSLAVGGCGLEYVMANTPDGARKIAAKHQGISLDEYKEREAKGLKWCTGCKEWHPKVAFGKDSTRRDGLSAICTEGRKRMYHRVREEGSLANGEHPRKRKPRIIDEETHWQCRACRKWKKEVEFYNRTSSFNGLSAMCIDCTTVYVSNYKKDNKERAKAWFRDFAIRERNKNPEKQKARNAVNGAIRSGLLFRPNHCEMCGIECTPQGHHDSYDKDRWLIVVWLCRKCHCYIHLNRGEKK